MRNSPKIMRISCCGKDAEFATGWRMGWWLSLTHARRRRQRLNRGMAGFLVPCYILRETVASTLGAVVPETMDRDWANVP